MILATLALVAAFSYRALSAWRILRNETKSGATTRRVLVRVAVGILAVAGLTMLAPHIPPAAAIDWPELRGLNFTGGLYVTPEFAAVVIAIVIYRGAFMAEILRGGFTSTSAGLIDAAKSLGMRPLAILWTVRLPIARFTSSRRCPTSTPTSSRSRRSGSSSASQTCSDLLERDHANRQAGAGPLHHDRALSATELLGLHDNERHQRQGAGAWL